MFSNKKFLVTTTTVILLSALSQPVLAQTRVINSNSGNKVTVNSNTLVRGNAALLGAVEVDKSQLQLKQPRSITNAINIETQQKVLLTPGAALPGVVGPGNSDRGVQVQINN